MIDIRLVTIDNINDYIFDEFILDSVKFNHIVNKNEKNNSFFILNEIYFLFHWDN